MKGRRPGLLAVLLVAVFLAGCGGAGDGASGKADPKPDATTATSAPGGGGEVPSGFRRVAVGREGFSVAIPSAWKDLPLTAEELEPFLEANPKITGLVGNDAGAFLDKTKFFAYDDSGSGTNVNVVKFPSEDTSVDDLVAGLSEVLVGDLKAKDVKVDRTDAPAGEAARASYVLPFNLPDGSSADVHQVQYHFVVDDVDYVLTFTLFGEFVGQDLPARMAELFRLT